MPNNTVFPPEPLKAEQPWIPSKVDGYVTAEELPEAIAAAAMPKAAEISGYKVNATQTLVNDHGTLKWVDESSGGE